MLTGKIIIVIGGEGLLGKGIVDDIRKKNGIAISADISLKNDIKHDKLHFDVTSEESIISSYKLVAKHYGKIDGIVNNAYPRTKDWGAEFEDITQESWKTNVDIQMNAVVLCIQKIIPYIKETNGSVVSMGSIYGVVGNDFTIYENTKIGTAAPYNAIKGGLINLSRYLASMYGKDNIRFNLVSPGGIFDHQDPKFVEQYNHKVPMKRMGNPDDIGPAVSFLLSKDAKYITGQNLIVDGGWTSI
jgi:NAD(P)-dependent dehydrogenase (short-subunit alcohol dehydrogenase family)